uniref:CCHC-type domain-containing protein n=2 Tax=Trichogramma kaykai TaxID=54128 RepID=A0ABD2WSX0_9HYME
MQLLMQTSCVLSSQTRRYCNQPGAESKISDAALRVPWCCNSRKTWKMLPPSARNWKKVLGDTATASALQHTTMIEIRDLDECTSEDEFAEALSTSLSAPHINKDAVKTLLKAYPGTEVTVATLPDDLAAKALKLGHIRICWVNCRIRGRKDTLRCYRCWSAGHISARCKGPDRSVHCFRCGQTGHQRKDCKNNPTCFFCQEQGAVHDHASTSQYCPFAQKIN